MGNRTQTEQELLEVRSPGIIALAEKLDVNNKDLQKLIDETGKVMKNLGKGWEGNAYDECNKFFQKFVTEYPTKYRDVINSYIKYLHDFVPETYAKGERKAESLSNNYKF